MSSHPRLMLIVGTMAVNLFASTEITTAQSKKKPLPSQVYHTIVGGGGLIEGQCIGVEKDNFAVVQTSDRKKWRVPLELFDAGDLKLICDHFGVEASVKPAKGYPATSEEKHPWHSLRGGVMVFGKIVAIRDNLMDVVDGEGNLYRVPYDLLAAGARDHANIQITRLTASAKANNKKIASKLAQNKSEAPKDQPKDSKNPKPSDPTLPSALAEALGKMQKPGATPAAPSSSNYPSRKWKDPQGKILLTGRYVELRGEKVLIADSKGKQHELVVAHLHPADQKWVELTAAGAKLPLEADEHAETPSTEAGAVVNKNPERTWKLQTGVQLAQGRFRELKDGVVTIIRPDGGEMPLPLDLLSDADRQYAHALAKGRQPGKTPEGAVAISSETASLKPSLDRRKMILLDGKNLSLLSADGKKKLGTKELPGEPKQVLERPEYYIAAIGNKLMLLDRATLKPKSEYELWKYRQIRHVSLHPKQRISFLVVESGIDEVRANELERQRLLAINEQTGDMIDLGKHYATWSAVDPTGKFLLTGFKSVKEEFGGFRVNPGGQIIEQPKWENTDVLRRFKIAGDEIELDEVFENAGANGQSLVISPDGNQVAYLSYTGYPTFSGNVALFEAANFEKKPVTLKMKDLADCKRLAFHPSKPLAASPGEGCMVLYNTQTGDPIDNSFGDLDRWQDIAVHEFSFSADGSGIVMIVSQGGGDRFILTADLTEDLKSSSPN